MTSSLFAARSTPNPAVVSHGTITIRQRERPAWYNEEHHSYGLLTRQLNGFFNPWKSFHKPTLWEVATGASIGKIEETAHAVDERDPVEVAEESLEVVTPIWATTQSPDTGSSLSPSTLTSEENLSASPNCHLSATWLGHAGVLVQIPFGSSSINILVDPIFSARSSPAQSAGPSRIVKSPCTVADLPQIHILAISHNHYDHLDLATLLGVYKKEKESLHIFVPSGNKSLLVGQGIPSTQITESDWWEEHDVVISLAKGENMPLLRVACTPAQHNSGEHQLDSNSSLWSSWYFSSYDSASPASTDEPKHRVYFAGDTGLRYRDQAVKDHEWETCPIFLDIAQRYGTPDLALLPISVGGTLPYVKSWDPAPAGWSLVPEIPEALTSSTHMSPADAVDLHKLLLGHELFSTEDSPNGIEASQSANTPLPGRKRLISLAIHFGTFCSGPAESRDTIRTLRRECKDKEVLFMKLAGRDSLIEQDQESSFVVMDHGATIKIAVA
ncbi:Metallo-hydrolase/oxidoreductase [Clavulina sp. PMI_390]|nr:Metallo-hydrolase/oxidoreductase [Clavulina sp. PMI_390]